MSIAKQRVIENLHLLQNSIYDTREFLLAVPTTGRNARQLVELFDMILKFETQLSDILDDHFWV